jgi:hypothetical protein
MVSEKSPVENSACDALDISASGEKKNQGFVM